MYDLATTDEFDTWLDRQPDDIREIIATRIARAQSGLFGDHKMLIAEGVSELRIHAGPGYRVYFTIQGRILIVLLCGGTKRTQKADIKRAGRVSADL